jgi:hypothetical protein
MARKLTKEQRHRIERALAQLDPTAAFLAREDVAVGFTGRPATTTLHFVRPCDGESFVSVAKDMGTDLVGWEFVRDMLTGMLAIDDTAQAQRKTNA